jgi:hypothetical protein
MSNITPSSRIGVRVGQQPAIKVISNSNAVPRRYIDLIDVDVSNLKNGDIAVYNSTTQKFVSQSNLTLTNLIVDNNTSTLNLIVNNAANFYGPVNLGNNVQVELDGGVY